MKHPQRDNEDVGVKIPKGSAHPGYATQKIPLLEQVTFQRSVNYFITHKNQ